MLAKSLCPSQKDDAPWWRAAAVAGYARSKVAKYMEEKWAECCPPSSNYRAKMCRWQWKCPIAEIGLGSPFLAVKFSMGLSSNVAQLSVHRGPAWLLALTLPATLCFCLGLSDPSAHLARPSRPQQEVTKSLHDTYPRVGIWDGGCFSVTRMSQPPMSESVS